MEISSFLWCFGYSPVSDTGFSWSLTRCFPTQCCRSQPTARDKQSWFGAFTANWGTCMPWLTRTHTQQLRLMSLCPWSPACAPGLGLGSLRFLHLQLEFTHLAEVWMRFLAPPFVRFCSPCAAPNLIFSEHFTPRLSHFAMQTLPCRNLTFSRYSSLFWPFFFNFHISPWLSQLHLCSKVETFFSASLGQAYPTFALSSDSSYSLNWARFPHPAFRAITLLTMSLELMSSDLLLTLFHFLDPTPKAHLSVYFYQ